jgi:imidazolonepropionase-like amidohydrolase
MIHIAHEEGFAVMAHVNGAGAVLEAAQAGVDSVEHGNFVGEEGLQAMAEHHVIWVPTCVTVTNLIGCGRFPDDALNHLKDRQTRMVRSGYEKGVQIGLGSDAGAYMVPHGTGIRDEYARIQQILGASDALDQHLLRTEKEIQARFCRG